MHILLLYHQKPRPQRKAISGHLEAFGKFADQHRISYWNIAYGLPPGLGRAGFDAILFHFTFFLPNINQPFTGMFRKWEKLKSVRVYKAALVQDEYVNTQYLCDFFREFGISEIFTCLPESLHQVVYPSGQTGIRHYHTVLTGYIDEEMLRSYSQYALPHSQRPLDIAYRARKMPYNLGFFGTFKWRLTEVFQKATRDLGLRTDLSNDPNKFIFGDGWYRFVGSTRTMLGCEGGSSLHDPDGSIRRCCEKYLLTNPEATFEQVRDHCFAGQEGDFPYYALSPRHFEAAVSKTCQVLVEGEYNGIFQPNLHYIPVSKDWSNLDEVLTKIADVDYCEKMAERAFSDIVASGKYTYEKFVQFVLGMLEAHRPDEGTQARSASTLRMIGFYHRNPWLYAPGLFAKAMLIEWTKRTVWTLGLDKKSWFRWLEWKLTGTNATR